MSKSQKKYFTFPIILLTGFMENPSVCLANIGSYCFFMKYKELLPESEDGSEAKSKANDFFGGMFTDTKLAFSRGIEVKNDMKGLNVPFSSISVDMAKDFAHNDKSEILKVTILAFMSLKSIAGSNDGAVKSTKQMLFSRMSGFSKPLAKPHGTNFDAYEDEFLATIPGVLHKWYNRRGFEKIRNQLQVFWGVQYYSYRIRGFYFSFKMPLDNLIRFAESNRIGLKVKSIKEQTKQGREKAIKELYPHLKSDQPSVTPNGM